jgi:DNA-binding transcriptional regulator YdaS (Cro superfamily)
MEENAQLKALRSRWFLHQDVLGKQDKYVRRIGLVRNSVSEWA